MATNLTQDLKDFRDFINRQLERGGRVPSPAECLELWQEWRDTHEAIREGLDQMRRGLGQPFDEIMAEFRQRNGIPPRSQS